MRDYDDARADEYDDWWRGTGLFADRDRPSWAGEVIGSDRVFSAELREAGCGGGGGGSTTGGGAGGGAEGGAVLAGTWFVAVRVPLR